MQRVMHFILLKFEEAELLLSFYCILIETQELKHLIQCRDVKKYF